MPGPGPSAFQVLVYSGPGVSPLSLSHTILTLSLLLLPHYTVQPVTSQLLSEEPWEPSCALLVIPGGRDLPYVEELSVKTNVTKRIAEYVREGGRYMGVCAGAYFGAAEVRFDVGGGKEVIGKRDLDICPVACVGPAYPGFDYATENGSRAVSLMLDENKRTIDLLYYNGGGYFSLPASLPGNVKIVARYAEPISADSDALPVAALLTTRGKGKALLCSVHFEYPLHDPPARDAIAKLLQQPTLEEIERSEKARIDWVSELLSSLGLVLPSQREEVDGFRPLVESAGEEDPHLLLHPTHPSPILVLSHPFLPQLGSSIFSNPAFEQKFVQSKSGWYTLCDGNDELEIGSVELIESSGSDGQVTASFASRRRTPPEFPPSLDSLTVDDTDPSVPRPLDFHSLRKTIILPSTSIPYSPRWSPLFNFTTYWSELDAARRRGGRKSGVLRKDEQGRGERAALGDLLFYGETVTSTQTMLDRNPVLLAWLPAPLVFLATFQLSGRGRGSNIWLSPPGCLQFSILLSLPQSMSNKMIFIQYLMALAVSEAVDEDGRLGVRIKWPNDIYAEVEGVGGTEVGSGKRGKAKLGGILVNTNFIGGQWRIVIGCGINVLNALPTTSLSQLHSLLTTRVIGTGSTKPLPSAPTMEGTFAKIMYTFEAKWEQFIEEKGFQGFMDEYHNRWLHSGQEVTLTTTEPHTRLRIMSLTPDHGLLRCVPLGGSTSTSSSSRLTPLYDRDDSFEDRVASIPLGRSATPQYVDLQPDGNSFDLMSGMIKRKV